jgi:hypothetical protein
MTKTAKFKSQHQDQDYISCSLTDKTETMNLIASVPRSRLKPRLSVSKSRLKPKLNGNNCDDSWPHQSPKVKINLQFLFDSTYNVVWIIHIDNNYYYKLKVNLQDSKIKDVKTETF